MFRFANRGLSSLIKNIYHVALPLMSLCKFSAAHTRQYEMKNAHFLQTSLTIAKLLEAYIFVTTTKQDESLNICNSIKSVTRKKVLVVNKSTNYNQNCGLTFYNAQLCDYLRSYGYN